MIPPLIRNGFTVVTSVSSLKLSPNNGGYRRSLMSVTRSGAVLVAVFQFLIHPYSQMDDLFNQNLL